MRINMKKILTILLFFICSIGMSVNAKEQSNPIIINDFSLLSETESTYMIHINDKPTLDDLISTFPTSLGAWTENGDQLDIPVNWICEGEDYENTDSFFYQFNPEWDISVYSAIVDAPYISVIFTDDTLSPAAVTSNSNEWKIFNFLKKEMGLNSAAAAGVLANIYHESKFDPTLHGDRYTSYGICQWHNSRKSLLISWCGNNGYDYTSLEGQLNYLKYELSMNNWHIVYNGKTIHNYLLSVPNTAQGAYDAGYYWCYYYEIPSNKGRASVVRGNFAKNTFWPQYCNITTIEPDETWDFTDVMKNDWFYEAVRYNYDREIMQGTSTTQFSPLTNLTRAQFTTILYRISGENVKNFNASNIFKDVPANSWYANAINWASETGIVAGYSENIFKPDTVISREQMATMLYRYSAYKGLDISQKNDLNTFNDIEQISDWALTSLQWANGASIINGKSSTILDPQGNATRAECAVVIKNFMIKYSEA